MSSTAGEQPDRPTHGFPFDCVDVAHVDAARHVLEAARALARLDTASLSDDECLGAFDQLEAISRALAASTARVLGEVDSRDLCDRRYGTSTRVWWERRHGRSRRSVGKDAITAAKLRNHLGELAAALQEGRISYERVELIASKLNVRNCDAIAAAQGALLALSEAEPSYAAFAALVDDLARYADADGGHDPTETTSTATVHRAGGQVVLAATLVGPDGDTFEQLLEAATNALWRRWRDDHERCPDITIPSRNELRAQALVELVRRGVHADPDTSRVARTELTLLVDADRVDELDPILASVLNGTTWSGPTNPFDHDHSGPTCAHPGDIIGLPVTTGSGQRTYYSARQWQLLVCNSDISEVLLDQLGMPVAVRDRLRTPNRAMRRALDARDGGCVFPGCDAPPSWCDAHHVIHYNDDGRTVTVNLALLCRRHHGVVHRSGWSIRLTAGADRDADPGPGNPPHPGAGMFTITTPRGLQMATQHRPRPVEPDRQPALAD